MALAVFMTLVVSIAPAQAAVVYRGDWRMTVHHQTASECEGSFDGCEVTFDIRTNQPGWEGSDQYEVQATLNGKDLYADAGQTYWAEVDPRFAGVRAVTSVDAPLRAGAYTLRLDWFYRGVWSCGPEVPSGCGYVGREHVRKTYKFRWPGRGEMTVRPFVKPASSVSASATRAGSKTKVTGKVKAQRLSSKFIVSKRYFPVEGAKVTLQSYAGKKRSWVERKTVRARSGGKVAWTGRAPKAAKWRWVVAGTADYRGSKSRPVKR